MGHSRIIKHDAEVILDSLNDGVVTISMDKKVKYLNRAAEQLLGYTLEEARNRSCATIVHCEACESDCLLEKTISARHNITGYATILHNKSGQRITVSSNTALLKDGSGRVIGGVEVIRDLRQLEALTEQLKGKYAFENIIGKNHQMQEIYALLPVVAKESSPILIEGERGTGKEMVAQAIHQNSPRRDKPFIKVQCGGLAEGLLASELFGHSRGAFAGALEEEDGVFAQARGGTVFLEEVGLAGPSVQGKLAKALREGAIERVGDDRRIPVDVRIIAGTSPGHGESGGKSALGSELSKALSGITVSLPPLRERRDDIPLLVEHFIKRFGEETGKRIAGASSEAMQVLLNYDYPENIQELESVVAHAVIVCQGNTIRPDHLPRNLVKLDDDFLEIAVRSKDPLRVMKRQVLLKMLNEDGWNYKKVADRLNWSRTTLWRKIKELGIERPRTKPSESS
jgi:PAS domain S-box-containing protein